MRLLLLEDDPILGDGLAEFLRSEGHSVQWCQRLCEATPLVNEPWDALVVDWQLPDGSGLDWVSGLRRRGLHTPVLVITARDLLSDRIKGLDTGADDYLVKPFAPEELSARIRAATRRAAGMGGQVYRTDDVEVDLTRRLVTQHGIRVDLTAREWSLLEALTLRAGRTVSKADLEAIMLGFESELSSNAIEVHLYNIRRKLGKNIVETVRGLGYRVRS